MEGRLGQHYAGELRGETAEAKGGRIVAEELLRLGWGESELVLRRKNDPDKIGIAVRLRRETTLSIKDNARLHSAMKDPGLARSSQRSVGIWMEKEGIYG